MKASIILVCWNQKDDIDECLTALINQTYKDFKIIIVDNGSTDGSIDIIKKYPEVKLIENKENLGFAKANEIGFQQSDSEYYIMLNLDTKVGSKWLNELLVFMDNNQEYGIATSKILYMNDPNKINVAGVGYTYTGYSWARGLGSYILDYNKEEEVASGTGCSMIIRSSVYPYISIDTDMNAYCEDSDMCWRARLLGYKIGYVPTSIVYHKYHTAKISDTMRYFLQDRNRLISVLKNYSFKTLLIISPMLLFTEVAVITHSILNKWFKLKMSGYKEVFNKNTFVKRKEIQQSRKIKDKEIIKLYEGIVMDKNVPRIYNIIIEWYYKSLRWLICLC